MITDWIDDHLSKEWFKHSLDSVERGQIYLHDIQALQRSMNTFYDKGLDKAKPYNDNYIPNPYRYQYDLFIHMWLHFFDILKEEVRLLRRDGKNSEADTLEGTNTLYGISREDCFWAAAEIRWPTEIDKNGSREGHLVRDPWSERRVTALSHPTTKYVAGFGGGGQGKTTVFVAFSMMMWDHYMFTAKGARCMISTTNKDKLNSVAWPYVCNTIRSTRKNISLYAGRGEIRGDYTIKRPQNKDSAGVFKGLLLGSSINEATIVDKLTGTHGHPFVGYTLDEATTTPMAPMNAALNFTMHAKDYRICLAGNYDTDGDTLGSNVQPKGGWSGINELTGEWHTKTKTEQEIIVLHFNNNESPGVISPQEGGRYFPHMPSLKILDAKYPIEARNFSNLAYRRFWIGFRATDLAGNIVLTSNLVSANRADQELILIQPQNFFSFDSAPGDTDRNIFLNCQYGICPETHQQVFGPKSLHFLPKATESISYYTESAENILKHTKELKIESGMGIVDWTGRPAQAEYLAKKNFFVERLIYNQGIQDGILKDTRNGQVYPPLKLNIDVDFKNSLPGVKLMAHQVAKTRIDLGAYLCREYIRAGRLRGLNSSLFKNLPGVKSIEIELYTRMFEYANSKQHGSLFTLSCKEKFRKQYGFSPDILDTLFQMCYFAFVRLKIPLTSIENNATVEKVQDGKIISDKKNIHTRTNEIWNLTEQLPDERESRRVDLQSEFRDEPAPIDDYWQRL